MGTIGRVLNGAVMAFRTIPPTWWIIWFCAGTILLLVRHKRSQLISNTILIYGLLVLISTVLSRSKLTADYAQQRVNLDLMATWAERFSDRASGQTELLLNFCMLIPMGFLFSVWKRGSFIIAILSGLVMTVSIELLQLITVRGFFELADIVDNIIGIAIGYGIGWLLTALWRMFSRWLKRAKN